MNRQTWKVYYRMLRIARRESSKAFIDMLLFGAGFVRIDDAGFVNHIHARSVFA